MLKIPTKITGISHPKFEYEVVAGSSPDKFEGRRSDKHYMCPTSKNYELSSSEYALRAEFFETAKYCKDLGL